MIEFTNTKKVLSAYFDKHLLNNAAVKVGMGQDVYFEFYRSFNNITETTLFDMASVTKIMATTMLTLVCIDENLLSFNTLLSDIFPQTPDHLKNLKISHLLTHTSGIGFIDLQQPENNYENIHNYILNFNGNPVGLDVEYSCPGFILLGKIIEKVYSKKLDELFF